MPISLLAYMTEIRTVSAVMAASHGGGVDQAVAVDGQVGGAEAELLQPLAGVQHGVVLDGGGDDVRGCRPAPCRARAAKATPLIAALSDSVPPLVKSTSWGRAPRRAAVASRASSTARRASRPQA